MTVAEAFTSYAAGDYDAPARLLRTSSHFHALGLAERRRLDRFLGTWNPTKAIFVLELANRASLVAPAYTVPLLTTGREYFIRNGAAAPAPGRSFERLWHQTALATLQRYQLAGEIERYADGVSRSRSPLDPDLAARLQFARAVAQEQRCWGERPALLRTGTPIRDANMAPLAIDGRAARGRAPANDIGRRLGCLEETAARFRTAASNPATAAESRVRLAWTEFQLGRVPEARRALDAVESGSDRELEYWARLFRGRIDAAMNRPDTAEREYRSALELYPHAQSAAVGLALVLFQTNRAAEADTVATELRARAGTSVDPWWTYLSGDARFVDAWIGELRRSAR